MPLLAISTEFNVVELVILILVIILLVLPWVRR